MTDYAYDAASGLVTAVTAPAPAAGAKRPQVRYAYGASGLTGHVLTGVSACASGDAAAPSCVGTADEVRTTIGYDAHGNVTSVARGSGDGSLVATTTASYTALGDVLSVDGPLSGTADTTVFRYDAARRLVGVISADPDGAGPRKRLAQKATYDAAGRATVSEQGTVAGTSDTDWSAFVSLQQSTTTYASGRAAKEVLSAGGTTYQVSQYGYDAVGRPECAALRMNPAAWSALPASACALGTAGTYGPDRIVKTSYDDVGRATKTTSAYGTAAQSDDAVATYSDNGALLTLTDAEGNRTTYEHDGFDRLLKTRYPTTTAGSGTSSTTDYEQLGYDAAGNVTSFRLRDGNTGSYAYDALDRLTTEAAPNLGSGDEPITYSYDLLGQLLSAVNTLGHHANYTYDALGRVVSETGWPGTKTMQYDLAGRRTRLTWLDGFYVTYDYDVTGNMTAIRENGAASGLGVLATFGYDDLGRRTSLVRGNGATTSYGYDAVSRLSSLGLDLSGTASDQAYAFTYNPAGQIASRTASNDAYTYTGATNRDDATVVNGLNQATSVGGTNLTHDARGNVSTIGSSSYTYNSFNELGSAGGSNWLYYEPLRRLMYANQTPTAFDYVGDDLVSEHAVAGGLPAGITRRYVHGPGTDEVLVEYDASGNRTWLQADERGSVVARSNDSGAKTAINSYDEYGVPAAGNAGRFGYTGQTWLPDMGLWYYKARMYNPGPVYGGRFMQTDPIGYGDGLNWYNYVKGDPLNYSDSLGTRLRVKCVYTFVPTDTDNPDGGGVTYGNCGYWDDGVPDSWDFDMGFVSDLRGQVSSLHADDSKPCVGPKYATFFRENYANAAGVASLRATDVKLLLAIAALESRWGTSSMATKLNNPFGATPRGDSSAGVRYNSNASAWLNWNAQFGSRVQGVGANQNEFISHLTQDNRGIVGTDGRGSYNSENPTWGSSVLKTANSVGRRLETWRKSGC